MPATRPILSVSCVYKNVSRVFSHRLSSSSHPILNLSATQHTPPNTNHLFFLLHSVLVNGTIILSGNMKVFIHSSSSLTSRSPYPPMAPGPPHRDGGQLSSMAHPASPPIFHKDRFAILTCPRIELNHLVWDKRISQSHSSLQHSSLFKSMDSGALSLTSCVTSSKILNLSVLPMKTGDSSTFLIGDGNIRCANIHKFLEQSLAHSKCCEYLSVLWFPAYPHMPSLSPIHTNTQACCPHATTNSMQSPKHTVWAISCLHNFVLTSRIDFLNSHISQHLAQISLLLWNFSSYPKGLPTETPLYPKWISTASRLWIIFKSPRLTVFEHLSHVRPYSKCFTPIILFKPHSKPIKYCNNGFTCSSFLLDHEGLCGQEPMCWSSPCPQHLAWCAKGT